MVKENCLKIAHCLAEQRENRLKSKPSLIEQEKDELFYWFTKQLENVMNDNSYEYSNYWVPIKICHLENDFIMLECDGIDKYFPRHILTKKDFLDILNEEVNLFNEIGKVDNFYCYSAVMSGNNINVYLNTGIKNLAKTFTIHNAKLFGLMKVEGSASSIYRNILTYNPTTARAIKFKEALKEAIAESINDFWVPIIDPSFTKDGNNYDYIPGNKPAIGNNYIQCEKMAKNFMPECCSRLGTTAEYYLFLGMIMYLLVNEGGIPLDAVWYAVCNNSSVLGHYSDSKGAKNMLENTGSRPICGHYDLANVTKILAKNEDGSFGIAGGGYNNLGKFSPLTNVSRSVEIFSKRNSVAWIVLERCNII